MPGKSPPVTTAISTAFGQQHLDADMLELLQAHARLGPPVLNRRTDIHAARRRPGIGEAMRVLREQRPHDAGAAPTARDITVQGAAGPLRARIYTPPGVAAPFPAIVHFHDGAWVMGSLDADGETARALCMATQAVVISVAYRLAPEHRFPAAWDDAAAAWRWTIAHAATLQLDASRMALCGEGAGATLAVATAIAAAADAAPRPVHVLAVTPAAQTATNTAAYVEHALAQPLDRATMAWAFERLGDSGMLNDPRLQLVDADLRGLPPVTLVSARVDPLRDDARRLHAALVRAQVPVAWQEYQGVTHGFFGASTVAEARAAQQFAGQRLCEALAAPRAATDHPLRQMGRALHRLLSSRAAPSPREAGAVDCRATGLQPTR